MELNREFKRLLEELGTAINESLSESERIGEVMSKIKASGYDLLLVLEVTIGFDKREQSPASRHSKVAKRARFQITGDDVEFLKELQISLDDESQE